MFLIQERHLVRHRHSSNDFTITFDTILVGTSALSFYLHIFPAFHDAIILSSVLLLGRMPVLFCL
jgi:hypothetical protein